MEWRITMFFICGISQGRKLFDYSRTVICSLCGSYGKYQVFMTYSYFSIFFIPIIKWDRRYYVQMSCCNTIYELNSDKGKQLSQRESIEITEHDLTIIETGRRTTKWNQRTCANCGYETSEDFEYCPKCGQKFLLQKIN